jgi:hypothetical protein
MNNTSIEDNLASYVGILSGVLEGDNTSKNKQIIESFVNIIDKLSSAENIKKDVAILPVLALSLKYMEERHQKYIKMVGSKNPNYDNAINLLTALINNNKEA